MAAVAGATAQDVHQLVERFADGAPHAVLNDGLGLLGTPGSGYRQAPLQAGKDHVHGQGRGAIGIGCAGKWTLSL